MDCPMNLDKYDEIRYKMLKCNVRVNEMNITSYGWSWQNQNYL